MQSTVLRWVWHLAFLGDVGAALLAPPLRTLPLRVPLLPVPRIHTAVLLRSTPVCSVRRKNPPIFRRPTGNENMLRHTRRRSEVVRAVWSSSALSERSPLPL